MLRAGRNRDGVRGIAENRSKRVSRDRNVLNPERPDFELEIVAEREDRFDRRAGRRRLETARDRLENSFD